VDNEIHALAVHTVNNLPDSIAARRKILSGLLAIIPRRHKDRPMVMSMANLLNQHVELQQEFCFENGNEKTDGK
jgi:hypothetical protein